MMIFIIRDCILGERSYIIRGDNVFRTINVNGYILVRDYCCVWVCCFRYMYIHMCFLENFALHTLIMCIIYSQFRLRLHNATVMAKKNHHNKNDRKEKLFLSFRRPGNVSFRNIHGKNKSRCRKTEITHTHTHNRDLFCNKKVKLVLCAIVSYDSLAMLSSAR